MTPRAARTCNDILSLVAKGNTYKEIGAKLNLSERTIKTYVRKIYGFFGLWGWADHTKLIVIALHGSRVQPSIEYLPPAVQEKIRSAITWS